MRVSSGTLRICTYEPIETRLVQYALIIRQLRSLRQLGVDVDLSEIGRSNAGGPAIPVAERRRFSTVCGSASWNAFVYPLLVDGALATGRRPPRRLHGLGGGPQPLADAGGVGEQEGPAEGAGPGRAASIRPAAMAEHGGVGLHQERRHQDLDGSRSLRERRGARQNPKHASNRGATPVGQCDLVHQRRLRVDVRRIKPQPAHRLVRTLRGADPGRAGAARRTS